MIDNMELGETYIILKEEVDEHFVIIDDDLVWHGGMNLLVREEAWDNLMRIKSLQASAELLEIVLGDKAGSCLL